MNSATEIVNGNGTSSIALAFFSVMVPLLIVIAGGIFKLMSQQKEAKNAAGTAADKADIAATNSKAAALNTRSLSNGFAGNVVEKLDRIIERQDRFDESFQKHLQWHLDKKT